MHSRTSHLLALLFALAAHAGATPPEPRALSPSQLSQAPYAATGLVSARVPGGAHLGSGSAVDTHVVLTAAHVFFDDERLGWITSAWTWQRAAQPETIGSYYEQMAARSLHVLAGYASAVQAYSPENGVSLEEFNRDTLCMVFYGDAASNHVMPLATESISLSGLKMAVGYPIDLPGGERPVGQMSAHGPGGLLATFTRLGSSSDRSSYTNQVYRTGDFTSGPGGSGGPLVSALDSMWKQTGVLVGGSADFSSILVRQIDADVLALIAAAKDSLTDTGSGGGGGTMRTHAWMVSGLTQSYDVFFRENGQAILASDGMLRFFNTDGTEERRLSVPILGPRQVAEAPNGAIYVSEAYGILAIAPDTGEILWRFNTDRNRFAVGLDSTLYTAASFYTSGLCAVSPQGTLEWLAPAATNISTSETPLAVLRDGTIVFQTPSFLKAFGPDGQERWSRLIDGLPLGQTLAVGPDDTIYVAGFGPILYALRPDTGVIKWTYNFGSGSTPGPPIVSPDGTIYIGNSGTIRVISPAGALLRSIPMPAGDFGSPHLALGSDDTLYVSTDRQGVLALSLQGAMRWTYPNGWGKLWLSPNGQLFCQGPLSAWDTLRVVQADSGPAPATWNALAGGREGGNRGHAAIPTAPRMPGWMTHQKVETGTPFTLYMRTTGAGPMSYVWRRDGAVLGGFVGPVLSVEGAASTDSGTYTVTATNATGSITSPGATITVGAVAAGEKLWQAPVLNSTGFPAIAPDGTVFVGGQLASDPRGPGYIFALDASGNEKWRHVQPGSYPNVTSLTVADDGGVFATTSSQGLYALSSNGGARWLRNRSEVYSNLRLALSQDGDLFVTGSGNTGSGMISRVSAADGHLMWSHRLNSWTNAGIAAPMVAPDGTILAGYGDTLSGYSPAGLLLWERAGVGLLQGFEDAQSVYTAKSSVGITAGIRTDGTGGTPVPGADGSWPFTTLRRPDGAYADIRGIWRRDGTLVVAVREQSSAVAVDTKNNTYYFGGPGIRGYDAAGNVCFSLATGTMPHTVLTRDGRWVGGSPIASYKGIAPVAPGPWASLNGDPGNTNRLAAAEHPVPVMVGRSQVSEGLSGGRLVLHADFRSPLPLAYQWSRDGIVIAGATGNRLVLDPLTEADAGGYRLVATASNGWTVSASWPVTVLAASTRAGYYRGNSGSFTVLGHVTPEGRLTLVAAAADGGFVVRDIVINTTGATSFSVIDGVPAGPAQATIQDGVLTLTLSGGINLDLTRTSGQQPVAPRPDTYLGGAIGVANERLDMIVDPVGNWVWRLSSATSTISHAASTPTVESTVETGGMLATFHADGTFSGTVAREGQLPQRLFASAKSLRLQSLLANISTRGYVQPGADPMIAGFVTQGQEGQRILLRAVGPTLGSLGVYSAAGAVRLDLFRGSTRIDGNQFWWSSADPDGIQAAMREVSAFGFESYSLDSALYTTLHPGIFTVHVAAANELGGIALVEVYDNGTERGALRTSRALNLSTRGHAGTGEQVLIAGFVIVGDAPKRLLLRGIGPGLKDHGVTGFCTDPRITLHSQQSGQVIGENDSWWTAGTPQMRAAFSQVHAFDLKDGSLDAGMVVYLNPGVYTTILQAAPGTEGTALVEVYEMEW